MFRIFLLAVVALKLCPRDAGAEVQGRAMHAAAIVDELTTDDREALLVLSIARHESLFRHDALNAQGDCGAMQVRDASMWGSSCAAMQASPRESYRVGLVVLRYVRAHCGGTVLHALGAYASGRCGGAPSVARELCAPVFGCAWSAP